MHTSAEMGVLEPIYLPGSDAQARHKSASKSTSYTSNLFFKKIRGNSSPRSRPFFFLFPIPSFSRPLEKSRFPFFFAVLPRDQLHQQPLYADNELTKTEKGGGKINGVRGGKSIGEAKGGGGQRK